MTDREELTQWFSKEMLTKLRANEHKGHWGACSLRQLFDGLACEIEELAMALLLGDPQDVIKEAADCGNFLAFIADRYRPAAVAMNKWAAGYPECPRCTEDRTCPECKE